MDGEGWDVRATGRGDRDASRNVHRRGRRETGRRDGDDYLALCTDREQSPNTLRARAFDLKAWLVFLRLVDVDLLAASPEHVDQFAGWLRRPGPAGAAAVGGRRWSCPGAIHGEPGLPPLAALEFQYLLQLRTDQRCSKVALSSWVRAVSTVIVEGVSSVRDRPAYHWRGLSLIYTTVTQLFTDLLRPSATSMDPPRSGAGTCGALTGSATASRSGSASLLARPSRSTATAVNVRSRGTARHRRTGGSGRFRRS